MGRTEMNEEVGFDLNLNESKMKKRVVSLLQQRKYGENIMLSRK